MKNGPFYGWGEASRFAASHDLMIVCHDWEGDKLYVETVPVPRYGTHSKCGPSRKSLPR